MAKQQIAASDKPQMLTVSQLSAMGALPDRAIRRLIKEGRLPTLKIGNRHYINLAVFERLLAGEL